MSGSPGLRGAAVFFGLPHGCTTAVRIDLAADVALGAAGIAGRRRRLELLVRLAAAEWIDLAADPPPCAGEKDPHRGKETERRRRFHPAPLAWMPGGVLRSQCKRSTGRETGEEKTDDALLDAAHGDHLSRGAALASMATGHPPYR